LKPQCALASSLPHAQARQQDRRERHQAIRDAHEEQIEPPIEAAASPITTPPTDVSRMVTPPARDEMRPPKRTRL